MEASTSRRAMLGILAAAPIVAAVPALATATTPAAIWDAALARYNALKARHDVVWAEYKHTPNAEQKPIGREIEVIGDQLEAAETRLWDMPAPHQSALTWKLEYLLKTQDDGFTDGWSAKFVAPVLADARRLAAREGGYGHSLRSR